MITAIKGKISRQNEAAITLEANGLSYEILTPLIGPAAGQRKSR